MHLHVHNVLEWTSSCCVCMCSWAPFAFQFYLKPWPLLGLLQLEKTWFSLVMLLSSFVYESFSRISHLVVRVVLPIASQECISFVCVCFILLPPATHVAYQKNIFATHLPLHPQFWGELHVSLYTCFEIFCILIEIHFFRPWNK